jgi:hypothetical protein
MTRRRTPSRRVRKQAYKLEGGSWHGHTLWLTSGGTLTFTLHGQSGRYDTEGRWQPCSTS